MSRTEFVALIAMMFATIAFSVDAMLPALPEIGATLSPDAVNRAQLVVTSFILGMGLGTFVTGPLSDSFGRKPVVLAGAALYIAGALTAALAQKMEILLAARLVQGLGAAGPRVVALAIIRDLYAGREMAKIMSFVMLIFTLVPALAPSLGALIIAVSSWRGVFVAFIVFSLTFCLWLGLRFTETLPPDQRRPFRVAALMAGVRELFAHPVVRRSIMVQSLVFGVLFSVISSTQQVFDETFGRAAQFPLWFGGMAVVASSSNLINAALVGRLGMRRMVTAAISFQVIMSAIFVAVWLIGLPATLTFGLYVLWQTSVFFQVGMTAGNLNAIAMEPVGHIAGMAASIIGAVSTVAAVMLAAPVGLMFDGTPLPLTVAVLAQNALALVLLMSMAETQRA
ncbi:MAG: multidrug effflux MFS transporter [Roseivivax sp.]|nr:multidrug effflux MFS transporter [Roseivivax sp.]